MKTYSYFQIAQRTVFPLQSVYSVQVRDENTLYYYLSRFFVFRLTQLHAPIKINVDNRYYTTTPLIYYILF